MSKDKGSKSWSIMNLLAAVTAAMVVRKLLAVSWKTATGKTPPANPAHPDVSVGEAVAWATVSGTAIGVARMLASRRAANYYRRSTGHLPAGMTRDDS